MKTIKSIREGFFKNVGAQLNITDSGRKDWDSINKNCGEIYTTKKGVKILMCGLSEDYLYLYNLDKINSHITSLAATTKRPIDKINISTKGIIIIYGAAPARGKSRMSLSTIKPAAILHTRDEFSRVRPFEDIMSDLESLM